MGVLRKLLMINFSNCKNIRKIETSCKTNNDQTWSIARRCGYIGLSFGCAAFLWEYYKNNINVVCKSESMQKLESCPTTDVTGEPKYKRKLEEAITNSRDIILRHKDVTGAPGIVICVSVNGRSVWSEGFGHSDLENRIPCTPDTVMRIASVSKSITMAVVAKLWENGQLDLDKPVQEYVPDFPKKKVDGKVVDITCRHLISHLAGIRHYLKKEEIGKEITDSEFQGMEYFLKEKYGSVKDSLKLFQDDELIHKPGEKYLYTTHGWTLVSAVLEKVLGEPFPTHMVKIFQELGMNETYLDKHEPIIYNRSHYYIKSKTGQIQNAPYVDNSYKWAGGGMLSTVGDLVKFGNIMLYSYQRGENCSSLPGYIKQDTVVKMWTPVEKAQGYGMGWVVAKQNKVFGGGPPKRFYATHSGGAIGASSILYILPRETDTCAAPSGVVVSIITNMMNVRFFNPAQEIAQLFSEVCLDE